MADLFVFYRSFRDAIREMNEHEQLETLLALCDYALDGIEPDLPTPMQRAKAARQAYINATGANPADVDAALKIKGATWHTAEGCKIIINTIAYWQNQGK